MKQLMKKTILVLLMLLLSLSAWARDDDDDDYDDDEDAVEVQAQEEEPVLPIKKNFGFRNRMFELSLFNMGLNVSNDVIAAADLLQKTAVINLDDIMSGIRLDFGMSVTPLSLNFNLKDRWGFGLDLAQIDIFGNVSLSGNLIGLDYADNLTTGVGAAVFVGVVGVPIFFHVKNVKVKIRPSAYLPVLYAEPGVTYSFNGERLSLKYDMEVYSIINLDGIGGDGMGAIQDNFDVNDIPDILSNNLGYDLGLGLEYPLFSWLDLGVDIVNLPVPFMGAKLNHYLKLKDEVYVDTSDIDILDLIDGGDFPEDAYYFPESFEPEYLYNSRGKALYRPFKMLFYVNYRFFDSNLLTLTPQLGFSINRLYPEIGSIEAGLSARLDLGNAFVTTLGTGYLDRNWKHSLDFIFNFRVFEIDLGVSVQSPDFVKSFRGAGAGVNFCLKMGL